MKAFVTLLFGLSLAFASAAIAQDTVPTPSKKKGKGAAGNAPAGQGAIAVQNGGGKHGDQGSQKPAHAGNAAVVGNQGQGQGPGHDLKKSNHEAHAASASNGVEVDKKAQKKQNKIDSKPAQAAVDQPVGAMVDKKAQKKQNKIDSKPAQAAVDQPAGNGGGAKLKGAGNGAKGNGKKLDPNALQAIKAQHDGFHAKPNPAKIPAIAFNKNFHFVGSNQWQGPEYLVFQQYHPEMHDQAYYQSTYGGNIQMFGGGAYYWNNGYWFPAWGYDNSYAYYPYDGPIYVGRSAIPVDRMIADVQATLQQLGYYQGEVDGLLGPLTRHALAAYQSDNGLYTTATMDEPTLRALGLG